MRLLLAIALACFSIVQDPLPRPKAFRELTLDAALVAARDEKKPVLLAFVRAGAPETQVMDELCWNDPIASRWTEARVVALRIDLDRDAQIAARFGVTEAPTTMFVTALGEEIERLVGFVLPDVLMTQGKAIARCGAAVPSARKALAAAPRDPQLHVELARAYMACKRFDKATEEFLWVWDHGSQSAEFAVQRRELLLYEIANLESMYKPARRELAQRRDTVRSRLFEWQDGDPHLELARDLAALNSSLHADDKELAAWETLRADERASPDVVEALYTDRLASLLFREARYDDLIAGRGDVLAYMDERYTQLALKILAAEAEKNTAPPAEGAAAPAGIDPIQVQRNGELASAGIYFEALCRTGKLGDARDLAKIVTTYDTRAQAYLVLIDRKSVV